MSGHAAIGQKALEARDYDSAIKHYSEALRSSNSPLWLNARSAAYQRRGLHQLALYDAEDAILEAISRGRRELIAAGQLRRAIALFGLKRFGDARLCFTWVRKLNEKEKGLGMWQAKVKLEYDKLEEDAEGRRATTKEIPDKREKAAQAAEAAGAGTPKNESPPSTSQSGITKSSITLLTTQTPKEKIKHEWYQSSGKVTITIFAKNVPNDQADIKFSPQSLDVSFPTTIAGQTYDFTLYPLFSQIDVDKCTYNITPSKIEINLQKAKSGLKWPALEGTRVETNENLEQPNSALLPVAKQCVEDTTPAKAPAYPTSSRKGAKNWDTVATEALLKEKKAEGKEISDDTGLDDDEEGDPLNGFFKKLYKDANPDTRRAMMKSYIESNGTALSTNWDDVSKKAYPVEPPEGVEAKKWES